MRRLLYVVPAFRPENRKVLYFFIVVALLMAAMMAACSQLPDLNDMHYNGLGHSAPARSIVA